MMIQTMHKLRAFKQTFGRGSGNFRIQLIPLEWNSYQESIMIRTDD